MLTDEEKIKLCEVVSNSAADYIKTSTGFGGGGATREDVALMAAHMTNGKKIKAAGGIANLQDARGLPQARRGPSRHQPHRQGRQGDGERRINHAHPS